MKTELFRRIIDNLSLEKKSEYKILDIGCGSGSLLKLIRNNVNEKSILIGTNSSEKEHSKTQINNEGIDFKLSKFVDRLDFKDAYFDIILSVDALECISDKKSMVKEISRVLKPNGQIVIAHWDWDTQVYHSSQKNLVRNIIHKFSDWEQDWMDNSDGQMGRKLWSIFEGSKLFKGKIEIFNIIETEFTKGYYGYMTMLYLQKFMSKDECTKSEIESIYNEMEMLDKKNEYFYSLNSYIYQGQKSDTF